MKRTAAVLLTLITIASPAHAQIQPDKPRTISKEVGPLLQQAQALLVAKNYKAAMFKVNEAEAVKSSQEDATIINQMRRAIEVYSSRPSQP